MAAARLSLTLGEDGWMPKLSVVLQASENRGIAEWKRSCTRSSENETFIIKKVVEGHTARIFICPKDQCEGMSM